MIDLYFWTTDNGYKGRMAAEESGLPYRVKPINIRNKEQFSPEFLKISPGHKIPAIADSNGPGGSPRAVSASASASRTSSNA